MCIPSVQFTVSGRVPLGYYQTICRPPESWTPNARGIVQVTVQRLEVWIFDYTAPNELGSAARPLARLLSSIPVWAPVSLGEGGLAQLQGQPATSEESTLGIFVRNLL